MTNDLQTRFDSHRVASVLQEQKAMHTLQNEHAKLRAALRDIEQIALDQAISPIDQIMMALNIAQTALAAAEGDK